MSERRRLGRFAAAERAWRDPAEVVAAWEGAGVAPALLRHREKGAFWETLQRTATTLLVTREYEHLVIGLAVRDGRPHVSRMVLPHPSGIAYDSKRGIVHVAATRNPNQVIELAPATRARRREDMPAPEVDDRPLVPVRSRFLPGSTYLHDLAMVGTRLHANAVGVNCVIDLSGERPREAWWPKSVDRGGRPDTARNQLQLNSIAAGRDLRSSWFTASGAKPGDHRPGDPRSPVDRRGVLFSGRTREPAATGLTRPHSARRRGRSVWVDDSGYGRVVAIERGRVDEVARLPGWTRGLGFAGGVAFVGTSRVIPRFRAYAPGLDVDRSVCAVHAIDARSGRTLGSLTWPEGNQLFAVEPVPARFSLGFPHLAGRRSPERARRLFYAYLTPADKD